MSGSASRTRTDGRTDEWTGGRAGGRAGGRCSLARCSLAARWLLACCSLAARQRVPAQMAHGKQMRAAPAAPHLLNMRPEARGGRLVDRGLRQETPICAASARSHLQRGTHGKQMRGSVSCSSSVCRASQAVASGRRAHSPTLACASWEQENAGVGSGGNAPRLQQPSPIR